MTIRTVLRTSGYVVWAVRNQELGPKACRTSGTMLSFHVLLTLKNSFSWLLNHFMQLGLQHITLDYVATLGFSKGGKWWLVPCIPSQWHLWSCHLVTCLCLFFRNINKMPTCLSRLLVRHNTLPLIKDSWCFFVCFVLLLLTVDFYFRSYDWVVLPIYYIFWN